MITSLHELSPATREAAIAWLDASADAVGADLRDAVRAELEDAVREHLHPASTPDDLAAVITHLGPVSAEADNHDPLVGSFAGIPFDLRTPTGERLKAAWWNPTDERLLVPKAFGAGWDLNVGALAVRLGLIEPDAEDVPFASTPSWAFGAAAALPLTLAAAVVAHYAVRGGQLPERLPQHWNLAGASDRWVSRRTASASDIATAALAAGAATWAATAARSHGTRAGVLAASSLAGTLVASVTVLRSAPDKPRWWAGPALATGALLASSGTLLGLALAGRNAERRRDLAAH